jgi:hypothetical protein
MKGVMERTRNSRLNGADLYVARFGGEGKNIKKKKLKDGGSPVTATKPEATVPLSRCSSSEGSLYDELVNPNPKLSTVPTRTAEEAVDPATVHSSRPCYRCVTYMHSVGIRRVFWSKQGGEWESAKVRDLVDALDGNGSDASGSRCAMFVTKHEVLMMRRMMGEG